MEGSSTVCAEETTRYVVFDVAGAVKLFRFGGSCVGCETFACPSVGSMVGWVASGMPFFLAFGQWVASFGVVLPGFGLGGGFLAGRLVCLRLGGGSIAGRFAWRRARQGSDEAGFHWVGLRVGTNLPGQARSALDVHGVYGRSSMQNAESHDHEPHRTWHRNGLHCLFEFAGPEL